MIRRRRTARVVDFTAGDPGGKALNLAWLDRHGALVPQTWIVDAPDTVAEVPLDAGVRYAVRSSGATEDSAEHAHAGEFLTELDVPRDGVTASVARVLLSGEGSGGMAVIVQEMVDPVASGVVFTRHPVTGLSDIVIEAIRGRGDALLQEGNDPLRWVVRNGSTVESPDDGEDLTDVVTDVVAEAQRLADAFGPADLEWVWDGTDLWWVQIRPITAIDDVPVYSRRIAKDVLPGMIKPLVWSVNIPMVNTAWVRLFTEAIGPNDLRADDLARSFAYRAYFDMRQIGNIFELLGMPRDALEMLLGLPGETTRPRPTLATVAKTPRMARLMWRLYRGGAGFDRAREILHAAFAGVASSDVERLTDEELVGEIRALEALGVEAAYLNIVVPLLANGSAAMLKRRLASAGLDFEEMASLSGSDWDPTASLQRLGDALAALDDERRAAAEAGDLEALDDTSSLLLAEVMDSFGHLSESVNDLSVPRWRDDPGLVLRLAAAGGSGAATRARSWEDVDDELTGSKHRSVRRWRRRAAEFAERRDAVGATFGFGYGLLRPRFLELGRRLVERGALDVPEDVFYLPKDRVVAALRGDADPSLRSEVADARNDMAAATDILMPEIIVGDQWVAESAHDVDRLHGVGTSRGRYRGVARFIASLSEADKLGEGEVLVVEHSDIAWASLFGRAGAVIAATGGMLAHSSITAREMGLPCVSSVAKARLLDGATVVVDGFTGEVIVEDRPSEEPTG